MVQYKIYIFLYIYIFSYLSTRSSYKRSKLDVEINVSTLLYISHNIYFLTFEIMIISQINFQLSICY